jgi:hypothetical protein
MFDSESKAQALPPEVTYEIFQYVDKDQLVSVALTCRSYQPEAERLIYKRVTVDHITMADCACLKTLATNPRKAVLVRSFLLDWSKVMTDVETLQTLGNALLGMKSLRLLYLQFPRHQVGPVQLVLNPILRCGCKIEVERVKAEPSFFQALYILTGNIVCFRLLGRRGVDTAPRVHQRHRHFCRCESRAQPALRLPSTARGPESASSVQFNG